MSFSFSGARRERKPGHHRYSGPHRSVRAESHVQRYNGVVMMAFHPRPSNHRRIGDHPPLRRLLNPFPNMRINARPSPADLAKIGVPSDGVGPHDHTGFGPHEHGEPSYTDEQVAFLEQRGMHVDRHHSRVLDYEGGEVAPGVVGAMLLDARQQGVLKAVMGEDDMMMTGACETPTDPLAVSGPGESRPLIQRLDLWQKPL
jgi:hypothetical protein